MERKKVRGTSEGAMNGSEKMVWLEWRRLS